MSEFKRLERLVKSLIPRIPRAENRQYQLSDARHMINDLGLQMPPEVMAYLLSRDAILDDFIMSIYALERELGRKVVTDFGVIDEALDPKVYVEDGEVGFSVTRKGRELIFAEYSLDD
jgi:hypothetical protein